MNTHVLEQSSGSSAGEIAGGVIGVLVAVILILLLIILIVVLAIKRRQLTDKQGKNSNSICTHPVSTNRIDTTPARVLQIWGGCMFGIV